MNTGYKVCDAMTKKPITISPETSLQECAKLMSDNHVGSLIVKEEGKPEGIITEQDIVRKSVLNNHKASEVKAREIMETVLHVIEPHKDIFDAINKMKTANIRHLPVVNEDEMIGLVTLKDILKIQPQLFDLLVEKFEIREEENKLIGDVELCEMCQDYCKELHKKDNQLVCKDCLEE